MGIHIKGMEMPKKGEYKPLFIYDTGEVTMEIRGEEVQVATAITIQPHGRLIDADALAKLEVVPSDNWVFRAIEKAPTIIEAEEGE